MLPDIGDDNANTYLSGTTNSFVFVSSNSILFLCKWMEYSAYVGALCKFILGGAISRKDYLTVKKLAFNITEAVEKFTAVPWSSYLSTKPIKA